MSVIIDEPAGLMQLCREWAGREAIGLDTEFLRERTYFAQLCLLQLSDGARAVCVDTLALGDLRPLGALLSDPAMTKVLHAARQDMEVLWPATGPLAGVFDSQVAAALIGLPAQIGYADLVRQLLGESLRKAETRTDWSRRPLSEAQVAYALDDVRYLLPLRERLTQRLRELGRGRWFEEEMAALDAAGSFAVDPEEAWRRLKGLSELDVGRRELARSLAAWRERRAVQTDRPRSWILPDAVLREIVLRVPRSADTLAAIPEISPGTCRHSGPELLALIAAADLPASLPPLPRHRRPDPASLETVRRLAQLTQQTGQELGIAPEILATRRELERLAAGERAGSPLTGWRREVIGERLLASL